MGETSSKRRSVLHWLFTAALVAVVLFQFLYHFLHEGKVMAESRNLTLPGQPTIKIRKMGSSLDDNPPYRFEYYQYSYPGIWSCQSYVGSSFTARSAQIEWSPDGTATVFLDHDAKFTCQKGRWNEVGK